VKPDPAFIELNIEKDDIGKRFDRIVRKLLPQLPLSAVYSAIRKGAILLNGKKTEKHVKVAADDHIDLSSRLEQEYVSSLNQARQFNFDAKQQQYLSSLTLFKNEDVIILNKPKGMLAHGEHSLETLVENYWKAQNKRALSFKPGPAHRLDRNTTGIQFFTLSLKGARALSTLFKLRRIQKLYIAFVSGVINTEQVWVNHILRDSKMKKSLPVTSDQGSKAVTRVIPVASKNDMSCILCIPKTGRTHQIRLQAQNHGHQLVGDTKYGGSRRDSPYLLHACAVYIPQEYNTLHIPALCAPLPQTSKETFIKLMDTSILKQAYRIASSIVKNNGSTK
jgi:23S rRNA pseudouridine955/2504/2580 synthase